MNLRLYRGVRNTHLPNESDEQLIHAILSGDLDRLSVLVSRHDALMRQWFARCMSHHALVEEAVQETWCHSFWRLQDLVNPQKLAAWLRRIATYCALEQGRKKRAIMSRSQAPEIPAPLEQTDVGWIWDLVDAMPADLAIMLVRHYRVDQSYDEIAALKHSTVRGRIYSARLELRRRLGDKP
ncbi:MAG: DNA-directed RNA polymerase specialized sigma24 family protein [Planctomycetota bacterium]